MRKREHRKQISKVAFGIEEEVCVEQVDEQHNENRRGVVYG